MAIDILKHCAGCKQHVAAEHFSNDARSSDGLQPRCRVCTNVMRRVRYAAIPEQKRAQQKEYYENNRERVLASNTKSRIKRAESVKLCKKAWYERTKDEPERKAKLAARTAAIKDWKREYDRIYRAKNPEISIERARQWRIKNPDLRRLIVFTYTSKRRAWEKDGDKPAAIKKWLSAQKMVCNWCGVKCENNFHLDHVEPLSRGGLHTVANLCVSCPTCNLKKNAKDPYEFAQSLGRLF